MGCGQMKNFWNKSWFVRIVSLLLAILIVVYIDSTQTGFMTQGEDSKTRQTANETETIRVPLQVSVDTDKYYVVGYPEKVKVTLEGPNALVTSAVNTQNFRAFIDLTKRKVGEQTVRVRITGLNKQISYSINPKTIKVNIQRRKSRTLPVQIRYNKDAVANGYHFGKATVDPSQVEVTGAIGEVNQIDQIVAKADLGRQLNVIIQPSTVKVNIPISISKKKVKLNLSSKNESSNKVYSVTAKQDEITLYGDKNKLDKIKNLNLDVDLRGINSSTRKVIPLKLPSGVVRSDPSEVMIQIRVKNTSSSKQS